MLESLGFRDTSLQLNQGQLFGLVKSDGKGKQMHVRLMPSGQIEAEIEPSHEYPFAHLNSIHSYSAHPELANIMKNYYKRAYQTRIRIPFTCIKRQIIEPVAPMHILTLIFGIIAIGLITYGVYRYIKSRNDSTAINSAS